MDKVITDINPLLLELYKERKMLVLCARDGQQKRILAKKLEQKVDVVGWWELMEKGFIDDFGSFGFLYSYDVIVVLDPPRIHPSFKPLYSKVLESCTVARSCLS
jgi:hypothetical protein